MKPDPTYRKSMFHVERAASKLVQSAQAATKATRKFSKALNPRPKMSLQDFLSFFPIVSEGRSGIDFRTNKASNKGHIHKHKPTWLPKTRIALTKAHRRRILLGLDRKGKPLTPKPVKTWSSKARSRLATPANFNAASKADPKAAQPKKTA